MSGEEQVCCTSIHPLPDDSQHAGSGQLNDIVTDIVQLTKFMDRAIKRKKRMEFEH